MQTGDNIRDQIKNAVINGRGDDGGWRKNIRLHLNGYRVRGRIELVLPNVQVL